MSGLMKLLFPAGGETDEDVQCGRAFIVTVIFIQPIRLCCRNAQVALVGPILRLSTPGSIQVARLLNRFDVLNVCSVFV